MFSYWNVTACLSTCVWLSTSEICCCHIKKTHLFFFAFIFWPAIFIPACASSSPAFLMMYSSYKLNKQGDSTQPWCLLSRLEPVCSKSDWKQFNGNSDRLYFLGSKITADGDCSHEIKRHLLLGRKVITNLDSILKSRDITLLTKFHLVKVMVFPVVMYGCEKWTIKKAEH